MINEFRVESKDLQVEKVLVVKGNSQDENENEIAKTLDEMEKVEEVVQVT